MSKTKRGKERKPNLLKHSSKPDATLYDATTMIVVTAPIPGRFYAVDHASWNNDGEDWICLFSGKRAGPEYLGHFRAMAILDTIPCGSMVLYLGKEWVPTIHQEYYKIGYGEYFGYIGKCDDIVFYDLGEDDSNESQAL